MARLLSALMILGPMLALAPPAQAQEKWVAGTHYTVLPQAQRTQVPAGKVEVLEVFSYGCPACNHYQPTIKRLKAALPPNAQLAYLPASWNKGESWPLFQRAYLAAVSLGIAEKAHDAMYEAIWITGELGVVDLKTGRLRSKQPTLEQVARLYERVAGVKAADFIAAANSFGVDLKARQADNQIIAMKVTGTPTLIVNGKYRINNENRMTAEETIELVKFLVAKETK